MLIEKADPRACDEALARDWKKKKTARCNWNQCLHYHGSLLTLPAINVWCEARMCVCVRVYWLLTINITILQNNTARPPRESRWQNNCCFVFFETLNPRLSTGSQWVANNTAIKHTKSEATSCTWRYKKLMEILLNKQTKKMYHTL